MFDTNREEIDLWRIYNMNRDLSPNLLYITITWGTLETLMDPVPTPIKSAYLHVAEVYRCFSKISL